MLNKIDFMSITPLIKFVGKLSIICWNCDSNILIYLSEKVKFQLLSYLTKKEWLKFYKIKKKRMIEIKRLSCTFSPPILSNTQK
jgi:hypothetical protein